MLSRNYLRAKKPGIRLLSRQINLEIKVEIVEFIAPPIKTTIPVPTAEQSCQQLCCVGNCEASCSGYWTQDHHVNDNHDRLFSLNTALCHRVTGRPRPHGHAPQSVERPVEIRQKCCSRARPLNRNIFCPLSSGSSPLWLTLIHTSPWGPLQISEAGDGQPPMNLLAPGTRLVAKLHGERALRP
jgi:hypothetical protein